MVQQLKSMTSVPNELHLALSHLNTRAPADGGTLLYDAVCQVAGKVLTGEKGRKAMVILSDGGDNGSRATPGSPEPDGAHRNRVAADPSRRPSG